MGHVVVQRDIKCVRTAKVPRTAIMVGEWKHRESVSLSLCLLLQGKWWKGSFKERICYPRTKLPPVSVHSSLVVLHFAEKETGDHFSCFPIQKDVGKHGFREKDHM